MLKRLYFTFCCVVFAAGLTVSATRQHHQQAAHLSERAAESPAAAPIPNDSFPQRAMVITYLVTRTDEKGISKSVRTRYVELDGSWREVVHGGGEDLVYNVGTEGTTLQKVKSGKSVNGEIPADTGLNTPPAQLSGVAADDAWRQRFLSPTYLNASSSQTDMLLGFKVYRKEMRAPTKDAPFDTFETWFAAEIGYTPMKIVIVKEGENAYRSVQEATRIEFKD